MIETFQDYAKNVKPLLDAGFTVHLAGLLGNGRSPQAYGGAKVLTGGKRIRGSLVCLVTAALGGAVEDALPRAVALELIQTATLIHDDFVDQHERRRDLPALWTLEGARKAVLLGDVIFASAIQSMSELGREDCLVISNAIAEVSRGAYQEPMNPGSLLEMFGADCEGTALYEKIIYLKTGVLFAAACQLGALAAKADDRLRKKWRCYGLKLGEAYQITDDLQEVEQYLITRSITGSELISIAPALLFFNKDIRPHVLEAIRQKAPEFKGEFLGLLQSTAEAMKAEIERRLRAAVIEIEGLPNNGYGQLARRTPWDIIRMFNSVRTVASLQ
jgi:geranylgeranyl pyrophosphate synthase